MKKPEISVVIPTYNRPVSLMNTLDALSRQTYPLFEVIIVDSSDTKPDYEHIQSLFQSLKLVVIDSEASVCIQRNKGIQQSKSEYVFLCDDDIEAPPDYVEKLAGFLAQNPDIRAVSGLVMQKDTHNDWIYQYPPGTFGKLLFLFIFQLSIWGDLKDIKCNFFLKPILFLIIKFYQWRGNTYSLGGWPLLTDFNSQVIKTKFYGIGASIIKREWLLASPYDEVLDPNGIGDNYGVILGFPEKQRLYLLKDTYILHHQSPQNRLSQSNSYQRRVLALHYFLKTYRKFNFIHRLFFIWSLIGNGILYHFKKERDLKKANFKALKLILKGKNPYIYKKNKSR